MVAENVTRILKFALWLTILITIFQLSLQQLTLENIKYAEIRCKDDFQKAEESLKTLWTQRTYPNDSYTHCYINCFLHKLGLIYLDTRGLNLGPFVQIVEKTDMMINYICTDILLSNEPLDGTCYSYYNKWLNFTDHCKDVVDLVFDDPVKELVDKLPRGKERGESATHFCDADFNKSNENVAAEVYDTPDNSFETSYKCNLGCIFWHFHYFDAYGRLDEAEIFRSYEDVHLLTTQNIATIRHCTHRGNSLYSFGYCEMAYELYNCLQKKTGKDYSKAYRKRDMITQQY